MIDLETIYDQAPVPQICANASAALACTEEIHIHNTAVKSICVRGWSAALRWSARAPVPSTAPIGSVYRFGENKFVAIVCFQSPISLQAPFCTPGSETSVFDAC